MKKQMILAAIAFVAGSVHAHASPLTLRMLSCANYWEFGWNKGPMYPGGEEYVLSAHFKDYTTFFPRKVDLEVYSTQNISTPAMSGSVVNQTYNLKLWVPMNMIGGFPVAPGNQLEIVLTFDPIPTTNPDVAQPLRGFYFTHSGPSKC